MIGVVIPVHNEEKYLAACLDSIQCAARFAHERHAETVSVMAVLDNCSDASADIAAQFDIEVVKVTANNVGIARHIGCCHMVEKGARWLACTDADTCVAIDWLSAQIAQNAEVVCGTVGVRDWQLHCDEVRNQFYASYNDRDGHRHIHGANIGVSAHAYVTAGGFPPLESGEDVALITALQTMNANIVWSSKPRVFTSARRYARCAKGFADYLMRLEQLVETAALRDFSSAGIEGTIA